jgi:hypothetical protein
MDKLQYVESSIKKLKTNIREYNGQPWGTMPNMNHFVNTSTVPQPVSFRVEEANSELKKDQLNQQL